MLLSLFNYFYLETTLLKEKFEKYKFGWNYGYKYISLFNNYDLEIFSMIHVFTYNKNYDNILHVDLRNNCPNIYDQGHLGSCTANSLAFLYHYDELKQNNKNIFMPSRLFIYYNERSIEGHINSDAGAEIFDGVTSISDIGVCSEDLWEYDITKFKLKPSPDCYKNAKLHKCILYLAIEQSLEQIKSALIEGFPVSYGMLIYKSFMTDEVIKTGKVPMPDVYHEQLLGGHALAIVGFNDKTKHFIIRNSWGTDWGEKGYGYVPYEYILNKRLASDFWIFKKVKTN